MSHIDWSQTVTPDMRTAERAREARALRDGCIASTMWIADRHRGQEQLEGETSITREQYTELLMFHQALRDWTTQPGWPDIDMPPGPLWLAEMKK